MNKHIAIVNPQFFVAGGAERQIANLANYLTDHNYKVTIMTTGSIPEFRLLIKEARMFEVGNMEQLNGFVKNLAHKFSIVNTHNHPAELLPIPLQCNHVWQCNEPPLQGLEGKPIEPNEVDVVKKYVDRVVVISDYDKERFSRLYGKDSTVIYPGVRGDYFSQPVERPNDKWRIRGRFVLLQMGYVTWTKNQVRSVEILAEVKKQIPNAMLIIGGFDKDAGYKAQIMNRAIELGVEEDVLITGYLDSDDEVRDLYHLANVHIMPCLDQGGWATVFEGMCAGLPTIVSDKFVAFNLIKDHKLGSVIPLDNTEKWADTIFSMRDMGFDFSNRDITSKSAQWIRDNLTWDKYGENYCKLFDEVFYK